jgi:hypothetical protein
MCTSWLPGQSQVHTLYGTWVNPKDTNFVFEQLIFHMHCESFQTRQYLEIDSNRNFKLFLSHKCATLQEMRAKNQAEMAREGFFSGQLTQEKFDTLITILRKSDFHNLEYEPGTSGSHSFWSTVSILHNGRHKSFTIRFPTPIQTRNLYSLILDITETTALNKAEKPFPFLE